VQGVGFRPFVYRIARRYGLSGWVGNDNAGAIVEAQGTPAQIRRFERALVNDAPPLCRITTIERRQLPLAADRAFTIAPSDSTPLTPIPEITVDTAVCAECLTELLNPADRRHAYPLINCTQCGPRFTIVRRTPYDRCNTTMHRFGMCPRCRTEYTDPADRRFHAQPIACHDCGPRVELVDRTGRRISGSAIAAARALLLNGKIIAVKGLGGFHLAARADRADVVRRLRGMKHRPSKPLALMVRTIEQARALVHLSPDGERLLTSPQAPIVLAPRKPGCLIAAEVAPANHRLGVMLAYTPLHHLLLCGDHFPPLVMTSANDGGEPLVIDNADALCRLAVMCDAVLLHDRPIERAVDDSVFVDLPSGEAIPIRRARGFVPAPLPLPTGRDLHGLAVGAELKSTVAVVRDGQAILSQHLGDLAHPDTVLAFRRTIEDLLQLFDIHPGWVAHDLHPAYASTLHAQRLASAANLPLIPVQHHHAHAAALLAEHGRADPALVIVCDGTGYGRDGTIWGGELLLADLCDFRRLAHLKPLLLPGGDTSARDPRRSALAAAHLAYGESTERKTATAHLGFHDDEAAILDQMITADVGCIRSSGAGRLFDAVAALLGICNQNLFESQAAMALESAAEGFDAAATDDDGAFNIESDQIDPAPALRALMSRRATVPAGQLGADFHEQFARAWTAVAVEHARRTGIRTVGLTGGVFCNARLTRRIVELLQQHRLTVLRHHAVPPNDGGIAFGQAAVASARMSRDLNRKAGA
jgi:hydrogenase maturation protein HypF